MNETILGSAHNQEYFTKKIIRVSLAPLKIPVVPLKYDVTAKIN